MIIDQYQPVSEDGDFTILLFKVSGICHDGLVAILTKLEILSSERFTWWLGHEGVGEREYEGTRAMF